MFPNILTLRIGSSGSICHAKSILAKEITRLNPVGSLKVRHTGIYFNVIHECEEVPREMFHVCVCDYDDYISLRATLVYWIFNKLMS
jgi:hypothetical protein